MTELSPEGLRAVQDLAHRTGFSVDAVTSMLLSIIAGRGRMAQFSHPEFGGSGQWMGGGAIMISDMFNNALKARVEGLCNELSALVEREPGIAGADAFQSQRQGSGAKVVASSSSLLTNPTTGGNDWWPDDLGAPSSVGAQNDIRYAYFPAARRLVVDRSGKVVVYDTQDHQISGFSQQQPGSGSISFSSQLGPVDLNHLRVIAGANETPSQPTRQPAAEHEGARTGAAAGHEDILDAIERLAALHARGILTEAEFSAKKAELLHRL